MMRGFLFLAALLVAAPVRGQDLPAWLDQTYRLQPGHLLLAGDQPALTRLDFQQFEVHNHGKATERTFSAVTILRPEGRERGRLIISHDKLRKITDLRGLIRDANGETVRKLSRDEIEDYSAISGFSLYEDNRVRVAELYHDEYPYTVEYEVEVRYDGLLNWPTWYPQLHGEGIEYGVLEILLPDDVNVRHTTRRLDLEPTVSNDGRRRSLRWEVQMLPAFEDEEFGPALVEQVGSVHVAPEVFEIEGTYGDMSTWDGFGRWYASLSQGADQLPPGAVEDVKRLAADAPDDLEKVRRVYAYLQDRTRYVSVQLGLGGWKPYSAEYVHERRYGDCKALSNYTVALLKAVGIDAYPALIRNGRWAPDVLADFPSNQFNHAIAYVPLAADTLWLETTSQTIPFGHIGASNEDRWALVVRADGSELVRTPRSLAEDNRQARRGRIVLAADGSAEAQVTTTYTGNQQDRLRGSLARASGKERDEWLHETLDIPHFEVISADFAGVDARSTTIDLPLSLRLPRYATRGGTRLFLTPALMDRWTTVPPAAEERTQDVEYFSYAFLDTDTLDYVLPEGYAVEAIPDPVLVESSFGRFESSAAAQPDGTIRFARTFRVDETRLPAESYDEFRDFLAQVARADRAQVVLVQQ